MFKLDKFFNYIARSLIKVLPLIFLVVALVLLALLIPLWGDFKLEPLPLLLSLVLGAIAVMTAWRVTARFIRAVYGLKDDGQGSEFLNYQVFGRMTFGPYLIIGEGNVLMGKDGVKKIGGPGGLVIRKYNAVMLEQAGRLTRVIRGPAFPSLEPFEKVWDVIDLRPQHWEFPVNAVTHDGIPIEYEASARFQVGDTDEDIFKAATCKWVRDAWRTEPDRLMTWTKRVIIGDLEGLMRAILARYTLDQLLDPACREQVRQELEKGLERGAPNFGVKILHVALGDIKLKGQVLEQWIEGWRAEREHEMYKTIVEGKTERAKILAKARADVRTRLLDKTADVFAELSHHGRRVSSGLVTLSFIEVLKRTSFESSLYLPENMVKTMDMLQQKIGTGGLPETSDSTS